MILARVNGHFPEEERVGAVGDQADIPAAASADVLDITGGIDHDQVGVPVQELFQPL